ncbi:MAG: DUF4347 domain-containing protein, partial [Planctomycetes bacterium]|nr:DUF4347 domain-containing protein [Planctomycetota bacterium]
MSNAQTTTPSYQAVFIDTALDDWQTLAAGVPDSIEVTLLKGGTSGLQQLTDWAATHSGYDAIHLISHGASGQLKLGTETIDSAQLQDTATQAALAQLGQSLTAEGDLLLYGCDVASGERGAAFVKMLGDLTGLNVAAATHKVGHEELGGHWELDYNSAMTPKALHVSQWRGVLADNTSPVLDATASPALGSISPNLVAPSNGSTDNSVLVSELINTGALNNFSDVDGNSPGIAITAVNSNGTLWYSTNGGTSWTELTGSVSDSSALTLYADVNTRVYFQPDTDYAGSLSDAITFKAWDQTGGFSNGQTGVVTTGSPTLASTFLTGPALGVTISGNYAYVADDNGGLSGLKIIDISDPINPTLTGSYNTDGNAYSVAVNGNYAYVGDGGFGLQIIDITNPGTPTLAANFIPAGWVFEVAISGNYAYLADGSLMVIVDISEPTDPSSVGSYAIESGLATN